MQPHHQQPYQQQPYYQQPGPHYTQQQPPKKSNTPLIIGLVIGGVVISCGLLAAVSGDETTDGNEAVAERSDEDGQPAVGEPEPEARARPAEGPPPTQGQATPQPVPRAVPAPPPAPQAPPACQIGQFGACACANGVQGVSVCTNGAWGACQCTQPAPAPVPIPVPIPAPAPAAVNVDAKGVPLIPRTQSNPPSPAEWASGLVVNTQGANSRPPGCSMRVVREWLKVNCTGNIQRITHMEGFGRENVDYFAEVVLGSHADFAVRLRPVFKQYVRIWRDNDRATLFVSWPSSRDRPNNIALGICTPALACWNR